MAIVTLFLMIAAVILFLLGAFNVGAPKVNLVALGLALWALATLLGGAHL
jgi:hypothetical protein